MKKNLVIGILLSFFATFLMSHNVGAVSRLGNYSGYSSGGISGLPTSWQYNRDTNVSATGNGASYVANGQFGWNLNWEDGKEYFVSIAVMMSAYSSSPSTIGSLNAEPINLQGDNYYTINDTITSQRSCSNSYNCRSVLIHSIKVLGTGNGSEAVKLNQSNLFNISDFWTQYSATAVMSWNAYIFEDYNEWQQFQSDVVNELQGIHSDTSDIVDTLGEINDKLDQLDSNADKNAEGWDNMQNTDGLIDVGDNTSFMDTFNSINSFFGGIKNVSATDCSFDFSNDVVDLGVLNFCSMPESLRTIISPIAAIIFSVVDIFLAWGSVKYIVSIIDWARRN